MKKPGGKKKQGGGLKCPECGVWATVLEVRMRDDNSRRRTLECGNLHKFTTVERVEHAEHGGHREGSCFQRKGKK